jgi:hypothetical protein
MDARPDKEQLKKQALLALDQARGEISSEAQWLRWKLNPRLAAHRVVDNHTTTVLVSTFAAGLLLAWLALRDRGHKAPKARHIDPEKYVPRKEPAKKGVLATLLAAAVPLALKYATSRPVLDRIIARVASKMPHRARSLVP